MINKQLETNINNERLLKRLAENLNIDFVSEGSNLKKIADGYSSENLGFATSVDMAIANGFTTTMSADFLELFGRQYNIYRKRYNNISLYAYQEAVEISVDKDDALITSLDTIITPFKKGDLIYSDDNIIIEATSDINIVDMNVPVNVSLRVTMALGLSAYTIQENSNYKVLPSNQNVVTATPSYNLLFKRPVGLAVIDEFEEDFKLRLYEATYIANNGANSLISAITKEVPLLYLTEVDDYKNGRAIRAIYPYTQELIDTGVDDAIDTYIIPLVENNIRNKIIYGQLISVFKPEPLIANVTITFKNNATLTETYLDNATLQFNRYFSTVKNLNKQVMIDFIKTELGVYGNNIDKVDFIFNSPHISEETYNLSSELNTFNLPRGRFLHVNSIRRAN